jgi:DNA-binding response OmpR family regulator
MADAMAVGPGPILIVDDEPAVVRWLARLLTREGFPVETAADGLAALARARELRPPLIFLDVKLPLMNGFAVCGEIRRDPALADTHVIMISAYEPPIGGVSWRLGGAPDEYIAKPLQPGEIVRRAHAVLGGRRPARRAGAA